MSSCSSNAWRRRAREAGGFRGVDDHLFAPCDQRDGGGDFLDRLGRDHDGAVAVGVNEVVRGYGHAGDADSAAIIDQMNMGVGRHDRAGEHQEIGRHRVEVADRAVGDDAGTAEPLVDMGLDLAPERPEPGIGRVDVLDHRDARQRLVGDMLIIAEPHLLRLLAAARVRFARADDGGAGKGDDRLHLGKGGEQRSAREPYGAPRRNDQFERIADGRRVERPQSFKIGVVRQAGHGRSPSIIVGAQPLLGKLALGKAFAGNTQMHSDDSIPRLTVLPGLVPGIHVLRALQERRGWPGQARPRRLKRIFRLGLSTRRRLCGRRSTGQAGRPATE
jgi:hypothetical protein